MKIQVMREKPSQGIGREIEGAKLIVNSYFTSSFLGRLFFFRLSRIKHPFFGFLDPKNIYFYIKFDMKEIA